MYLGCLLDASLVQLVEELLCAEYFNFRGALSGFDSLFLDHISNKG
jgi:hypothetical protein